MADRTVKVFDYLEELNCFVVNQQYRRIADFLGLAEWNPVVWIGRLFMLDNDYGEHWMDNWDLRERLKPEAEKRGIACEELMIIAPDRFKNDADGPCHTSRVRQMFWTDVLKSLELSYDLIFEEARSVNASLQKHFPDEYMTDLEQRIQTIRHHGVPPGS